jgi:adenine/guanine/hypoxanthine permease
MVPGTALGVLVGDLAYTWLALRLARRTGRHDVTAMPFGIDTPTLFAMVFGVLGPVLRATGDPVRAWKIGMVVTIAIGVTKTALAFAGAWARRTVPRAALLGSIGGIAVLLIAFLPALRIVGDPLVGMVALGILLLGLMGGVRMPFGVPAAFAALVVGAAIFWGRATLGHGPGPAVSVPALALALPWPTLAWLDALADALPYLSVALPFALVTTIGGIDNTESAAAAGDEYRTRDILLTEAGATIIAGLCGGVIQNTPYIGHPAYKAMGARAGYTLATGLVIGVGAAVGVLAFLVAVLPEAAVAPILVFIGLEIAAQAFLASPGRHGPAVALSLLPVAATVVLLQTDRFLGAVGRSSGDLAGEARLGYEALRVLGNGFILTALLWASALVSILDRRFTTTALVFAVAGLAALCGLIHSPLRDAAVFPPWAPPSAVPGRLAGAYGVLTVLALLASAASRRASPAGETRIR